jgi:hypothetical protein
MGILGEKLYRAQPQKLCSKFVVLGMTEFWTFPAYNPLYENWQMENEKLNPVFRSIAPQTPITPTVSV